MYISYTTLATNSKNYLNHSINLFYILGFCSLVGWWFFSVCFWLFSVCVVFSIGLLLCFLIGLLFFFWFFSTRDGKMSLRKVLTFLCWCVGIIRDKCYLWTWWRCLQINNNKKLFGWLLGYSSVSLIYEFLFVETLFKKLMCRLERYMLLWSVNLNYSVASW